MKPGSATYPFFGVDAMIVRRDGTKIKLGMPEPSSESPQPPASKRTAVSAGDAQRPVSGDGNGGGDDEMGSNNATEGYLVLKNPWPGMARTIYLNHARFEEVYFKKFPGASHLFLLAFTSTRMHIPLHTSKQLYLHNLINLQMTTISK